jgi:hypothetical protein
VKKFFVALVAEYFRLTFDRPGTGAEDSVCLGSFAVRRATEEALSDEVMLCGMATSLFSWERVRACSSVKLATADGTELSHVLLTAN